MLDPCVHSEMREKRRRTGEGSGLWGTRMWGKLAFWATFEYFTLDKQLFFFFLSPLCGTRMLTEHCGRLWRRIRSDFRDEVLPFLSAWRGTLHRAALLSNGACSCCNSIVCGEFAFFKGWRSETKCRNPSWLSPLLLVCLCESSRSKSQGDPRPPSFSVVSTDTFSLRASLLLIAVKFALRDWSFCHLPGASGSLFNSTFPSFPSPLLSLIPHFFPLYLFLALSAFPSPVPLIFPSNSYNSSDSSSNLVHYNPPLSLYPSPYYPSVLIKQWGFY